MYEIFHTLIITCDSYFGDVGLSPDEDYFGGIIHYFLGLSNWQFKMGHTASPRYTI
jgi:hypothetical protein